MIPILSHPGAYMKITVTCQHCGKPHSVEIAWPEKEICATLRCGGCGWGSTFTVGRVR